MLASNLLISLLFGYAIAEITSPCGDWTAYKDEKCFKVFDSVSPETTAETICRGKESDSVLAIIKTSEEQEFIEKCLKASKIEDNVWIGIKKINNSFKWLDGTDIKYTNWAKDRPLKSSTDLNCVEIIVDEANYGKWMDDKCGRKNAILCEKIQPWSVTRLQNILLETRRELTNRIDTQKQELDNLKTKTITNQQKVLDSHNTELDNLKLKTIPTQQKLIDTQKADLDSLKTKTIPEQQKMIDSQKSEINNLKSNPVPIGFIYVQLSGQSDPNYLWPNTEWQNISSKYSGLFFRAEGGQSTLFGQIQEQQTQSFEISNGNPGDSTWVKWIKIKDSGTDKVVFTGTDNGGQYKCGIDLKHNNEEIRPRNQAIRIWQRTK